MLPPTIGSPWPILVANLMQCESQPDDGEFLADVREFISSHWSGTRDAWVRALVERGWSVPRWPRVHGGTGWSPARQCLWEREVALAGAPDLDPVGSQVVGPLLCARGTPAQQRRHLPAIREGHLRWCLALASASAQAEEDKLRAVAQGDDFRIEGVARWVVGARAAEAMLCRVVLPVNGAQSQRGERLMLVDLTASGVTVEPVRALDGSESLASVVFDGVRVPHQALLAGSADESLKQLDCLPGAQRCAAYHFQVLLERLRALARGIPDGVARLDQDPDFARKLAALGVDVAALEGLELRALGTADAAVPESLGAMLRLRRGALAQRLAELHVEAMGYHALPFPDPLLIDNEGPIGHHDALAAVTELLRSPLWWLDGGAEDVQDAQKARIARLLLGF